MLGDYMRIQNDGNVLWNDETIKEYYTPPVRPQQEEIKDVVDAG